MEQFNKFKENGFGFNCRVMMEFYPTPLPSKLTEDDQSIERAYDFFGNSFQFNYEPVPIVDNLGKMKIFPLDEHFEAISDAAEEVEGRDLMQYILQTIELDTFMQIPTRVEFSLNDDDYVKILKEELDPSIKLDDYGYPVDLAHWPDWLNEADSLFQVGKNYEESMKIAKSFFEKYRKTHSHLIINPLVDCLYDQSYGVYGHWETEITDENISAVRDQYSNWELPLMVMSEGKMWVTHQPGGGWPNFTSPVNRVDEIHIRNWDETPL